jgi:histidinol-phosphatase (PHP family)
MTSPTLVSIHGGHCAQFCSHAQNTLEEVIQAYIAKGFAWVGITEHMPPVADRFMYAEERKAGCNIAALQDRFDRYMKEGRRLQKKYADELEIFIGFETEAYTGAIEKARQLIEHYQPDYVLGGIHHVADIPFDASVMDYQKAVAACGGETALYCRYFDKQYALIQDISPKVVAHFDLIRIFDDHYLSRWETPQILRRIERNLQCMADMDLILDYNVAALRKGAAEPYISKPLLQMAKELGIAVVPGDDSHASAMVGAYVDEGIAILEAMGMATQWRKPV